MSCRARRMTQRSSCRGQPGELGDRDEAAGRHRTALGVRPAGQGLHADDDPRRRSTIGWYSRRRSSSASAARRSAASAYRCSTSSPSVCSKTCTRPRPALFAACRAVSAWRSRSTAGTAASAGATATPMDAATCTAAPSTWKGSVRALEQIAGHRVRPVLVGVLAEDDELVAAEARDGLVAGHRREQPRADVDQQLVTDAVPARVVDHPEVVQVDEQDGGRALAPAPGRASAGRRSSVRFGSWVRPSCSAAARSSSSARRASVTSETIAREPSCVPSSARSGVADDPQPALVPVGVGVCDLVPLGAPSGAGQEPAAHHGRRCGVQRGHQVEVVGLFQRHAEDGGHARVRVQGRRPSRSRPRCLPPTCRRWRGTWRRTPAGPRRPRPRR